MAIRQITQVSHRYNIINAQICQENKRTRASGEISCFKFILILLPAYKKLPFPKTLIICKKTNLIDFYRKIASNQTNL